MGTLQACAQMKFETVQGTEEFAESQFPSSHPATFEDNGGSSGESFACLLLPFLHKKARFQQKHTFFVLPCTSCSSLPLQGA